MFEEDDEMDEVELHWADGVIPFEDIAEAEHELLDAPGFYALLTARRNRAGDVVDLVLLYIGHAFRQPMRQRIQQPHQAFEPIGRHLRAHAGHELVVMVGVVSESPLERDTRQLYLDIEGCLIQTNEPLYNVQGTSTYAGRPLRVLNVGDFSPLHAVSEVIFE